MKNHFLFGYAGNKRNEVDNIVKYINLNKIKDIVEPFCGTSAFSFYIASLYPSKFTYYLNDNNKNLISLYEMMRNTQKMVEFETKINKILETITKEKYLDLIKDSLEQYYIHQKVYTIRPGLFPLDYKYKAINLSNCPIVQFLASEKVNISSDNGLDFYKKFSKKKDALIFLDPPYLQSENSFYENPELNLYEYLSNNSIKKENAKIYLVLESNWIIKLLFKDYHCIEYGKKYEGSKKNTTHMIITNQKIPEQDEI